MPEYNKQLARLTRLVGSDPGIYLLALHSFIEMYLKDNSPDFLKEKTFHQNLIDFIEWFIDTNRTLSAGENRMFNSILDEHFLTNQVRHEFSFCESQIAKTGTYNFLNFCNFCNIENSNLNILRKELTIWDNKSSHIEDYHLLMKEKFERLQESKELKKILSSVEKYENDKKDLDHYIRLSEEKEYELSKLNDKVTHQKEKIDKIRSERGELKLKLSQIKKSLKEQEEVESYIDYFKQATYYTRTRLDYERSLLKLTAEQKQIINQVKLNKDFLVKGCAGTGKTLVLLEILKKATLKEVESLGIEDGKSFLFLTYTSTLVKYNKYISSLIGIKGKKLNICTVDSILRKYLKQINQEWNINYKFPFILLSKIKPPSFITTKELQEEIETFIYGNNVTKEEYIDKMIPRTGMKNPLRVEQRKIVWKIKTIIENKMDDQRSFSQGYACLKIIQALQAGFDLEQIDYIFLDEAQDIKNIQLNILKKLSKTSIILAGDSDQSIYGINSSYKRAGINIQGMTHILKTNFRNTTPIHEFAESYRQSCGVPYDVNSQPSAFRMGPIPELITSDSTSELYTILIDKIKFLINILGYEPENIAIIVPTNKFVPQIRKLLTQEKIECEKIKDPDFEFTHVGKIRIIPLPSSKGLDFPVVLCFLPFLPSLNQLDDKSNFFLQRNKVFVALTRAMENLIILCKENTQEKAIQNLITSYNKVFRDK